MAKQAGDFTVATRELLDEHGFGLTHGKARPLLKAKGIKIVPKPKRRSPELRQWEEVWETYEVDYGDKGEVAETIKVVRRACKFNEATAQRVHAEYMRHRAFEAERNHFDITKLNYRKLLDSGAVSPSARPVDSKNTKARTAKAASGGPPPKYGPEGEVKPKKPAAKPQQAELEALAYVEEHGGLAKVQKRIAQVDAEIAKLQQQIDALGNEQSDAKVAVELVGALQKRVKAAA